MGALLLVVAIVVVVGVVVLMVVVVVVAGFIIEFWVRSSPGSGLALLFCGASRLLGGGVFAAVSAVSEVSFLSDRRRAVGVWRRSPGGRLRSRVRHNSS